MSVRSLLALLLCASASLHAAPPYPTTQTSEDETTLHGTSVPDRYRWLENTTSDAVRGWAAAQHAFTGRYLGESGLQTKVEETVERFSKSKVISLPFVRGDRDFWLETQPGLLQPILQSQRQGSREVRTLVDPNKLATDGSLSVSLFRPAPNGKSIVYKLRQKGTQNFLMYVDSVTDGHRLSEVHGSTGVAGAENVVWGLDSLGFFYTKTVSKPVDGQDVARSYEALFYHKVGSSSDLDEPAYSRQDLAALRIAPSQMGDQYLALLVWAKSAQQQGVVLLPLRDGRPTGEPVVTLDRDLSGRSKPLGFANGRLLLLTNVGAPRQRVVAVDPLRPEIRDWITVVPEAPDAIDDVVLVKDKLVVSYFVDVVSTLRVFTAEGKALGDVALPPNSVITNTLANARDGSFLFAADSLVSPRTIYELDLASLRYKIRTPAQIQFPSSAFEVRREFVKARDGVRVPVFIAYRQGLKLDGTTPVMLTGYGGFNFALRPRFDIESAAWLALGGAVAVSNVRGGGEYGEGWHLDGMRMSKKNAFNDFVDCAQWLVDRKYTSPSRLGIIGWSNGGLLVSAAVNQRPDLFGAVVNGFGLTDMVRNESAKTKFDWTDEFGSVKDEASFRYMLSYSPLHNIQDGVQYPPVLVQAAELDDRVLPWHQYKYVAALQAAPVGTAMKLLAVSYGSGHAYGKSAKTLSQERTTAITFLAISLGISPQ